MADDTSDVPDVPDFDHATVEIELDGPATVKYARLCDRLGKETVDELLRGETLDLVTQFWKRRDELAAKTGQSNSSGGGAAQLPEDPNEMNGDIES